MLENLYTAATGMLAQQQRIASVANDLANASTTGYKDTRTGFRDLVYTEAGRSQMGGVRAGADIFKALALGANAVLIGRAYVYGLAVAGEAGVTEVLDNLRAELDLTMALAGCSSLAEVGPETLERV